MADVFTVQGTVTLDDSSFHNAVDDAIADGKRLADGADQQAGQFQSAWENAIGFSIGDMMSDFFQQGLQFMKQFVKESITAASDLQEVQNVVDVTFGEGAHQIEVWAKTARTQYGLTELQAKRYTSTMGAMLKSMGMTEEVALDMSTNLAGLAADMASFYNIDFDDAFGKIRSGIAGETEPLKQLGINLSVANLEAFALANGIDKSYESMTESEKAMLRYNYIMSVTADAQGDFARTSDSYANSLRTFETNIESLKATLGEQLLPVLNEGLEILNGWLGGETSLSSQMAQADASFAESAASIAINDARAQALIGTLETLSQKTSLNEQETAMWNAAVSELTAIYPSLKGMIGDTAGTFNTSADAIRAETSALKENALEKAKVLAMQNQYDLYADALTRAAVAQVEYDASYAEWIASQAEVDKAIERYAELAGITKEAAEYQIGVVNKNNTWSTLTPELREQARVVVELQAKERGLSGTTYDLGVELSTLNGELAIQEEKIAVVTEALGQMDAATVEATGSTEGATRNAEELSVIANDASKNFGKLTEGLKETNALFKELEQYKLDNFNAMKDKVEGVYGAFDKAGKVRKQNPKTMLRNMDSQIEQLDRWMEARQALEEMGASDELLSQFDYSPESIAQMEAIVKSGTDGLADFEEKLDLIQEKEAAVAQTISDTALKVDETFQNMLTTAETAQTDMQTISDAISQSVSTMATGVQTDSTTATEAVGDVTSSLADLNGTVAHVFIQLHTNGGLGTFTGADASWAAKLGLKGFLPHETGLDYVPYDEYAARLHKGEAVLTKAEADNWRKGRNSRTKADGGIHVTQNIQAVPMTPHELAMQTANALQMLRFRV